MGGCTVDTRSLCAHYRGSVLAGWRREMLAGFDKLPLAGRPQGVCWNGLRGQESKIASTKSPSRPALPTCHSNSLPTSNRRERSSLPPPHTLGSAARVFWLHHNTAITCTSSSDGAQLRSCTRKVQTEQLSAGPQHQGIITFIHFGSPYTSVTLDKAKRPHHFCR